MSTEQKKGKKKKDAISGYRITLGPANAMVKPKTILLNIEKSKEGAAHV